jgi:hypothetical protein
MTTTVEYEAAVQKMLEPDAVHMRIDAGALVSIAISMKRIADVLADPSRLHFTDAIMTAIEQGILSAGRQ